MATSCSKKSVSIKNFSHIFWTVLRKIPTFFSAPRLRKLTSFSSHHRRLVREKF